jgi:predicted XRE-type DNA-binding protein
MRNGLGSTDKTTRKKKSGDVEPSSGNVFADLGFPKPEEELAKADLAIRIGQLLTERKATQKQAASLLGIDQPKVSALLSGKLEGFSTERLLRFMNRLGQDVSIVIRPATNGQASTRVVSEARP